MTEPFLYLTTVGRTSGLPRTIEIWFVSLGGRHYLVSERRDASHWGARGSSTTPGSRSWPATSALAWTRSTAGATGSWSSSRPSDPNHAETCALPIQSNHGGIPMSSITIRWLWMSGSCFLLVPYFHVGTN